MTDAFDDYDLKSNSGAKAYSKFFSHFHVATTSHIAAVHLSLPALA
jgi:hypothetical protein